MRTKHSKSEVFQQMRSFLNDVAMYKFPDEVVMNDGRVQSEALREKYDFLVKWARDLREVNSDYLIRPQPEELESKPDPFAEMCVHTICNAFYREEDAGFEFHPKLGSVSEHVKGLPKNPAGTFNYVKSIADLKIVCDDLLRLGETYYVFWDEGLYEIEGEDDPGVDSNWIVWTPNRPRLSEVYDKKQCAPVPVMGYLGNA